MIPPNRGPRIVPLRLEHAKQLKHVVLSSKLWIEGPFHGRNISTQDGGDWKKDCNACFKALEDLQIAVIPDGLNTFHVMDIQFMKVQNAELESVVRTDMEKSYYSQTTHDHNAYRLNAEVEVVEVALSGYFNVKRHRELKAEAGEADRIWTANLCEQQRQIAKEIERQTSQEMIAQLVKKAGELSVIRPFTLLESVTRPRFLCPVPGCTGKSLCPVWAHEGECNQTQCPLASDFLHIRKTCFLEVTGEKCFDWSNEHRNRMVHQGEEGGEEDWVQREALAKLRHAHEKRLWLVGGLVEKLGALKLELCGMVVDVWLFKVVTARCQKCSVRMCWTRKHRLTTM